MAEEEHNSEQEIREAGTIVVKGNKKDETSEKRRRLDYIEEEEALKKKEALKLALEEAVEKTQEKQLLPRKAFRPLLVIKEDILSTFDKGVSLRDMASSLSSVFEVRVSTKLLRDFIIEYDDSDGNKRSKKLKRSASTKTTRRNKKNTSSVE
jgi:hypothetical protein